MAIGGARVKTKTSATTITKITMATMAMVAMALVEVPELVETSLMRGAAAIVVSVPHFIFRCEPENVHSAKHETGCRPLPLILQSIDRWQHVY